MQLHCPPWEVVYYRPEVFSALEDLKRSGKLLHYGVSVEKVEEALKATEFPGVATVQIIFNLFRQRPKEFFSRWRATRCRDFSSPSARQWPLKRQNQQRNPIRLDDHRQYNRQGEHFDRGDTFSGVDFDAALVAVEKIRQTVPPNASMADLALRWILQHEEVSCVIPGARKESQVIDNAHAVDLPALSREQMEALTQIYQEQIRSQVHQLW